MYYLNMQKLYGIRGSPDICENPTVSRKIKLNLVIDNNDGYIKY